MCCVQVQGMVCELRAGFSRALLELNQIQQGDTELQSQLEDTRHGCNKRALHLESLVLSLKVRSDTCLVNLFCMCLSKLCFHVRLFRRSWRRYVVSFVNSVRHKRESHQRIQEERSKHTHADMHKFKV